MGKMNVSFAIMAHPSRSSWVEDLQAQVPEAVVVWDQKNNRWDTGRRSLMAFDALADWHVVIQDDCILPPNFVGMVTDAINNVPGDGPIGLYFGRTRPRAMETKTMFSRAIKAKASWILYPGPYWGVGIAVPTADIPHIVKYGDGLTNVGNYDLRIARYYESVKRMCNYTLPSLVEHRTENNPSLVPGRTGGNRKAYIYVGSEPVSIRWDGPQYGVKGRVKQT